MSFLILADERSLDHRPPKGHPERPERYLAAVDGVHDAGFGEAVIWRTPNEASTGVLTRVHDLGLVEHVEQLGSREHGRIDTDTYMSSGSLTAARLAAGAGLDAIAALEAAEADTAFCLVRPPGHHATPTRAMGFCLFNNVAVCAQALTDKGRRVAIIDFDAHHGNGTQDAFYDRDDVLFVSMHEYPQYPGSGALDERGIGKGAGYTINIPLPSGATGNVYLRAFDEIVEPALENFKPDWLLVSAGFDAHRADPLTNLGLTAGDYSALSLRIAQASSPGRRIAFLEGGYDLDALANSTAAFVGAFVGSKYTPEAQSSGGPGDGVINAYLEREATGN